MTGEIINLRKFRKDAARAEKDKLADANRAKFGATKAEKLKTKLEQDQNRRLVDGAHLAPIKDDDE